MTRVVTRRGARLHPVGMSVERSEAEDVGAETLLTVLLLGGLLPEGRRPVGHVCAAERRRPV